MKRKLLSIILTTAILLTLLPLFSITAAAAEMENYANVWANNATSGGAVGGISDSASGYRKLVANALGAPDAYNYTDVASPLDNTHIAAMRYHQSVTFTFGGTGDQPVMIYNNPDHDYSAFGEGDVIGGIANGLGVAGYDLCLFEATVGAWHPEAVEITLLNAEVDGAVVAEYKIGVAFNNVGNMLLKNGYIVANGVEGFSQKNANVKNLSATFVWFPENVASAEGVKLRDLTADYNQAPYTNSLGSSQFSHDGITYKWTTWIPSPARLDGFDLDAIGAWTADEPIELLGAVEAYKFNDLNLDGVYDPEVESPLGGFEFQLLSETGEVLATALSADDGSVIFGEWPSGLYKIVEVSQDGWVQTSYVDGIYVQVDETFTSYGSALGSYDSSDPLKVGNGQETPPPPWTDPETAWAGWATDDALFPHNASGTEYDGVVRTGASSWAMAVRLGDGVTSKTVDLIAGQHSDVGDVVITDNGDNTLTVEITMDSAVAKLARVHTGLYSTVGNIPGAPGQHAVNTAPSDEFYFSYTFAKEDLDKKGKGGHDYVSGSSVVISLHTEVCFRNI